MREEYTRNCFAEILVVCRCCVAIPYMALQRSQWTFLSCLFTSWLQIVKTKGRQQTTGEGHWTFAPLFAPELITDIGAAYLPTCTRKTVRTWIRCVCIHDVISNPTTLGSCKSAFELLAKAGGGLEWRAGQSAFMPMFFRVHVTWNRCATHGIDANDVLRPKANEGFINYTTDYY